jgi:hypothetical protein
MVVIERRHRRFLVTWPLQYRRLGTTPWLPARTVNISITGILFQATQPPALAENLELRILTETPTDPRAPATVLATTGRVVRHEPALEGAVAVEFHSHMGSFNILFRTVDRSLDTQPLCALASEEPNPLTGEARQGLVECAMCHRSVSQLETLLLAGQKLCFGCLAAWYD